MCVSHGKTNGQKHVHCVAAGHVLVNRGGSAPGMPPPPSSWHPGLAFEPQLPHYFPLGAAPA